ncbi:MAG: HEPN domain-containing protein [Actinobacteria bacterium]|nr:HEPN domain-containing protein [Actinomycetota bacterium]
MQPDPRREYERWIRQARHDLDDAEFNAQGGRYHLACFLSQQAAEKAIKAYLYLQGHQVVWGHSAAELVGDAATGDMEFAALKDRASLLDRFYIPTRYPNGLPGGIPSEAFNAKDAEEAVRAAGEIITFVLRKGSPQA